MSKTKSAQRNMVQIFGWSREYFKMLLQKFSREALTNIITFYCVLSGAPTQGGLEGQLPLLPFSKRGRGGKKCPEI